MDIGAANVAVDSITGGNVFVGTTATVGVSVGKAGTSVKVAVAAAGVAVEVAGNTTGILVGAKRIGGTYPLMEGGIY